MVVSSRIAELVREAPDWARVDPLCAEVRVWLDRAYQTVFEVDLFEASILQVHAQFLDNDVTRHGSEIVKALRRVEMKRAAEPEVTH